MLAAPTSWRTYHAPRDSSSTSSWLNVYVWSGKWPQKMIACDQRLRTMLAVKFAQSVALNDCRPPSNARVAIRPTSSRQGTPGARPHPLLARARCARRKGGLHRSVGQRAHQRPRDVVLGDLKSGLSPDPLQLLLQLRLRLLAGPNGLDVEVVD